MLLEIKWKSLRNSLTTMERLQAFLGANKYHHYPFNIPAEVEQTLELKRDIVNKILLSKRLLIDHVECLEFCLDELPTNGTNTNCLTFLNCSILFAVSTAIGVSKAEKLFLPTVTLFSFTGMLCIVKTFNKYQNKLAELKLEKFISSIEDFGNCVKRNISYFNEIQFMHFSEDDNVKRARHLERVWNCIKSIKDATVVIYDATRNLEEQHRLSEKLADLYLPMEELRDCDYFKKDIEEYSAKNIKDFYNIFAYVQSQFFLRLAFTTIEHTSASFLHKNLETITDYINKSVQEEEEQFKKMSLDLGKKRKDALSSLYKNQDLHQICFGPSSILKESSLKLSSGLIAVAEECYKLDEALQRISDDNQVIKTENAQNLIDLASSMRTIENSLSLCCDNFHRLMIVYNKFLGSKLDVDESLEMNEEEVSEDKTTAPQLTTESCEQERSDDFYAYMFDDQSENTVDSSGEDNSFATESQLLNLEENITKKKFKPVLKQLKDKIDPIRQEMLDKERKVLEAKGVNVDKLFAVEEPVSDADSAGSDDSEGSFEFHRKKRMDQYSEMRQFLAQKADTNPAVNLFKLQLPAENVVNEDILE